MLRSIAVLAVFAALTLAGCGDDEGEDTPATTTQPAGATGASGATGAGDVDKEDATAQSDARSAQTAVETYATDHGGSYAGVSPNDLDAIEPVTTDVGVTSTATTYSVTADSNSGNTFTIERAKDGTTTKTCTEAGVGGCDENGDW